jgi:uncharacterized protein (TIGR00369 family)
MAAPTTRMEIIRAFIPTSPLPAALGIRLRELAHDHAVLELPWAEQLATMADVVHGGAVATLADTAAMAAAWGSDEVPEQIAGSTISLALDYLAPARGDLTAVARVSRRGGRLCFVRVEVSGGDGALVATAQAVYRLG